MAVDDDPRSLGTRPEAENPHEGTESTDPPQDAVRVVPTGPQLALGSDLPVGGLFNRTRALIRAPSRSASGTVGKQHNDSGIKPQSLSGTGGSANVSVDGRGAPVRESNTGRSGPGPSRLAARIVEDYLQAMLPSSLFTGGANRNERRSLSPAASLERPSSKRNSKSDASPKQSGPGDAAMTSSRAPPAALEVPPSSSGDSQGLDMLTPVDAAFTTTWRFQQMTADGGVTLTFDDLERVAEEGEQRGEPSLQLDALHGALEALVEEHESPVDVLQDTVARQLQTLVSLRHSLSQELKPATSVDELAAELNIRLGHTIRTHEPGGEAGEAGQAQKPGLTPVHEEQPPQPSDDDIAGGAQAQAALSTAPDASPTHLTPKQGATLGALPEQGEGGQAVPAGSLRPPRAPTTTAFASAAAARHLEPQGSIKEEQLELRQQLQTLRTQLTTTIQQGFKEGRCKRLNFAILVVGTRGDVQPFVGIGLKLKSFGHRVRIASHAVYREFVTGFGLEFFPLGGDPKVLSEFVVKHRGIMPGFNIQDALQQREQVREILYSTWGACTAPDPANPGKPFVADAIVANPPSYGHTHCAEALNVPLHIVFTMPWTPTKAFPQPFARIKTNLSGNNSKAREVMNWLSYFAMEDLAWLGMAGMQKDFRQRVLGLKSWNKYTTSHAIYYSQVPVTYIWSPSLVPRASDWPVHCEVAGFCSVELHKLTSYTPPDDLKHFLEAGLRALIQRGWGGLGSEYGTQPDRSPGKEMPPNVLFIDTAPHDWLFQHVSCVIHHGGAGTTAAGLMAGKPTFIVPFFGDQPFWGAACERAGVGPAPIPIDSLTTERIVDALKELILPTRQTAAAELAARMRAEDGVGDTVDHIHRTVYTALLGQSSPIWMRQKTEAGVPLTRIQESGTADGDGELHGELRIPVRNSAGLGKGIALFKAVVPGASVKGSPNVAGSAKRSVPVVEAADCRGGFTRIMRC